MTASAYFDDDDEPNPLATSTVGSCQRLGPFGLLYL